MTTLIIADHNNQQLASSCHNLVTAAAQLQQPVSVLVAGHQCQAVAEQAAALNGVDRVLLVDDSRYEHGLAEVLSQLVAGLAKDARYVLAAASTSGKNLLPRVAALLDSGMLSDVVEVVSEDTFKRPVYAGNAIATVKVLDPIRIMTVRPTAFDATTNNTSLAAIESIPAAADYPSTHYVSEQLSVSERPELGSASIVVSGGRGVGSKENFGIIEQLADTLGAAVGASRAAVDAGFVDNDLQVGQTGKIVAPELYIAVGISGAIQHLAGMKDSKVIVAINKDEEAPIFQVADYGLNMDLFDAVPQLKDALS